MRSSRRDWLSSYEDTDTQDASDSLLVPVSREKDTTAYENFIEWKISSNARSFTEDVFLAYFNDLANKHEPSTLWSIYSMLKSTVWTKHGIDIKPYSNLTEFLRRRSDGSKKQKPKTLSANDVDKFLKNAPDSQYLATKVALIFGIAGGCKREELRNITTDHIDTHGKMLVVRVTNTKKKQRSFPIHSPFYEIVKKYEALRTPKAKTNFFFQNYQNGKCMAQPIGLNKFSAMPKEIAKFLGLPNANSYTGHSFKTTSATLRAASGAI